MNRVVFVEHFIHEIERKAVLAFQENQSVLVASVLILLIARYFKKLPTHVDRT